MERYSTTLVGGQQLQLNEEQQRVFDNVYLNFGRIEGVFRLSSDKEAVWSHYQLTTDDVNFPFGKLR